MSNNLCQTTTQFASYEFKSLTKEVTESSPTSQNQILEQLLFALTNQMAIAADQNKNINQHFSFVQPNFTEFSANDGNNNETSGPTCPELNNNTTHISNQSYGSDANCKFSI